MDRITEENCGTKISIASAIYGVKTDLRTETDPISETLCSQHFLEYWTMDEVQKLTNFECSTPSSELIRIYLH
jgi:hypothetical protein